MVVSNNRSFKMKNPELHPMFISYKLVEDVFAKAGYGFVNPIIQDRTTSFIHKSGSRHVAVYRPNRFISTECAVNEMNSMVVIIENMPHKGRPATVEELVQYEVDHHQELSDISLVALGEKLKLDSGDFAAIRRVVDGECGLHLFTCVGDWIDTSCFLVVFEPCETEDP